MSDGERFMRQQKWNDATPAQRVWAIAKVVGGVVLILLILSEIVYS